MDKLCFTMIRMKIPLILSILAATLILTGCGSVNNEFSNTRSEILSSINKDIEREMEFRVGPATTFFIRPIAKAFVSDRVAKRAIKSVRMAQGSIHKLPKTLNASDRHDMLDQIDETITQNGWTPAVRVVEGKETINLYLSSREKDQLNRMFIVFIEGRDMYMVEAKGQFTRFLKVVANRMDDLIDEEMTES